MQAAERTLEKRAMLTLTGRDSQAFVDAILNAPKPGRVLRLAAAQYRKATAR